MVTPKACSINYEFVYVSLYSVQAAVMHVIVALRVNVSIGANIRRCVDRICRQSKNSTWHLEVISCATSRWTNTF